MQKIMDVIVKNMIIYAEMSNINYSLETNFIVNKKKYLANIA